MRLSAIDVLSVLLGDDQRIADLHERAATEQGAGGTDRVDLVQLLGVAHHAGHDVVMAGGLDGLVVKGEDGLTGGDDIARLDIAGEALAIHVDGVQADVDEKSERREMDGRQRREELACKDADRAREEELQNRQLREQKIDRYVRIAVAGAELVLPLMFYGIWMRRGFKFEESGVYSSTTFRNLFSRFRPTK